MSSLLVEKLIRAFWQYTLLGYLIANVFQNQISSDTRASDTQKGDRVITEDWCWCHWKQHLHCFQCKIWYCISWSLELFCELDYGPCTSGNVDSRNTEKHSINFKNEWTSLQVILCWISNTLTVELKAHIIRLFNYFAVSKREVMARESQQTRGSCLLSCLSNFGSWREFSMCVLVPNVYHLKWARGREGLTHRPQSTVAQTQSKDALTVQLLYLHCTLLGFTPVTPP